MSVRRKFLLQCGAAVATILVGPRISLAQDAVVEGGLNREFFLGLVKQSFHLHDAEAAHQGKVKLVRLLDYPGGPELEQFGLRFRGSAAGALPEGLYTASGWSTPPFPVYIKPTRRTDRWQFYMADFSLLQ